ncbi:hypothetical protein HMPREF9336_04226 [Segniliparus rugosus ATCC BAA-974]|uniref:Uncharacterized protein n=1 Tax=Segniliparus rugosus (strain ATCC BAA-974 / DSM 45345 / CCUG 50838 / CIP 108380 / JCM 13579 / CDC 945) TaxID=679197 RepID=U1M2J7_SEGRC|nr:hypothetical protein HMPREF9336_04226 [Segniliparus rugosus ATCC BAA-974]
MIDVLEGLFVLAATSLVLVFTMVIIRVITKNGS